MNKYEKVVAFMNNAMEYEFADLGGGTDGTVVYIITDLGDLRLHEDEVDYMAENWNRTNPHKHD